MKSSTKMQKLPSSSVPLVVKYEDIHGANASPKRPDIRFEDEAIEKENGGGDSAKMNAATKEQTTSVERPRVNSSKVLLTNQNGEPLSRKSMIDEFKSFSKNIEGSLAKGNVPGKAESRELQGTNQTAQSSPKNFLTEKGGPRVQNSYRGGPAQKGSGASKPNYKGGKAPSKGSHRGYHKGGTSHRFERPFNYPSHPQFDQGYAFLSSSSIPPAPPMFQGSPTHYGQMPLTFNLNAAGPPPHYPPQGLPHGHHIGVGFMNPLTGPFPPPSTGVGPVHNPAAVANFTSEISSKFSPEHLQNDLFLRCCMDSEGWITINALMHFSWVQSITSDIQVVSHCLGSLIHIFELSIHPNEVYQCIMINDQRSNLSLLQMKFRLKHDSWRWVLEEGQRESLRQQMFPSSYHPYYG